MILTPALREHGEMIDQELEGLLGYPPVLFTHRRSIGTLWRISVTKDLRNYCFRRSMDWNKYSYVARGRNRKRILLKLASPMTPTQLTLAARVSLSHVSKALRDLRGRGLVECINPQEKVGKVYKRTRDGDEIAEYLLKLGDKAQE